MERPSILNVLRVAAVISYFTERGVASLQASEGSKEKARKMSIGSEKGSDESSCEVGSEVEKQGEKL